MENTSFGPENVTRGSTDDTGFWIFLDSISFPTYVVGLIGNGLVIFLTGCRMKTTVSSIWFLNLAIADFIFLLLSTIQLFLILGKWYSVFTNEFISITTSLNMFASILFILVISLDRCLCAWMVVWARNKQTVLRAKMVCVIVWVSSIIYILPFFNSFNFTVTFYVTYQFVLGFLIPYLIVLSSYIAIGVRIKHLKMEKKLKSYRLIITVILAFFICWVPYNVCCFALLTAINNNWSHTNNICKVHIFTIYLAELNTCLNPFLYVFTCDDYKKKLKESLLLVLETAFAEDHLNFRVTRHTQKDEQEQKNKFELFNVENFNV